MTIQQFGHTLNCTTHVIIYSINRATQIKLIVFKYLVIFKLNNQIAI